MYKKNIGSVEVNVYEKRDRVKVINIDNEDEFGVKDGMTGTVLENAIAPYVKFDQYVDWPENTVAMIYNQLALIDD